MKKYFLLLLTLPIFSNFTSAQTGVFVPELVAFDSAMHNLLNTYDIPGGQLAITYNGRLVYNRGFGLADEMTRDSVYPNSIFRLASISKTLTGITIMKMYEENLIDLDAQVFGPNGILNDSTYLDILDSRCDQITVRMLLQHTAGWDRDISGDVMFDAYNIANEMGLPSPPSPQVTVQAVLKYVPLDFTPGTRYAYSNFGYCVLGRVIEKISGQPYEDYVRNTILLPLGCTQTRTGYNLKQNKLLNEVTYHDYRGAPMVTSVYDNITQVPWPYGGFNIEFMDAHGGWVSSGEELMKLLCAIDKYDTRPDILMKSTIDTMLKASPISGNYGLGIASNGFSWWHNGALPGTATFIYQQSY
jgi:CubicO group peptidase (beta-lactamase class C family)